MTWKLGREDIAAGPYQQRIGTVASSFTGVNVGSQATAYDLQASNASSVARLNAASLVTLQTLEVPAISSLSLLRVSSQFIGHAAIRGTATINSGTTVVSVSATGVVSGDVIITTIYMYSTLQDSLGRELVTAVESVRANAFEIKTVGSVAPTAAMPIAWFRIA